MKYLKKFNENVSFYDYLKPGELWSTIGASTFEKLEKLGHVENITSSEGMILDDLVNKHIVSLGWKLKGVDNRGFGYKSLYFKREYVFNSITSLQNDIKFLKYEDDLWLIESFIPKGTLSISKMWVCDSIEGVKDCIENNF